MVEKSKQDIHDLKTVSMFLEEIVPTIDKIGSGFSDRETMSLALLLFFKKNDVLDKLATVRKIINKELSLQLTTQEYDEWLEKDISLWIPPYNKSKDEIINMFTIEE
ncbi:hypothetical protein [Photorhabdus heterorhabditis]|uniref:hypothetical protein n=1 Tax=Photorhabdus heterorhabditis TaxID=880156 RepID=UPI001561E3C6|nr:hypothetical protein [Photorhabdus heterorhabditis]NRN30941.1 hypothetical protein [Photorhabdus heterorhabditis subsp. aluminescens]